MSDDITIGVTEIVNNIEVTAQPNDQIVDISVTDNADNVTLNITPTVIEINVNKGSSYAKWGTILGTLSDQTDLQDALNLKADLVDGKVPSSQLPSYVDDIIEVANYAALPATGEIGKIYVTIDNNKIFRWTGSTYVEIIDSAAVWGAITGTLSSQTDLQNALNLKANDNAVVKLTGDQSITGSKSFTTNTAAPAMVVTNNSTDNGILLQNTSTGRGITSNNVSTGIGIRSDNTGGGTGISSSNTGAGTGIVSTNTSTTGSALSISNSSTGYGILLTNSTGTGISSSNTGSGTGFYSNNSSTGNGIQSINSSSGYGISSSNTGSGRGIYSSNNSTGDAINIANSGSGRGIYLTNASTGNSLILNNTTAATGMPFTIQKNGTDVFTINDAGEATGVKFIKSGGTSSQFLKADGSVDSSTYALTSQLHDAVTLGTTGVLNGLSLSGQVLSLATASSTTRGALTSEDYNYFFGKQNALTNPVTGTGTTNYIPKFTGSSAIGNSLIYDNGTNVGIGTTSPAEKLSVSGAVAITGGITGHGANRTTLSQEGANGAYWQSYGANTSTAGVFALRQASSDFSINRIPLFIDTSGNLGIGTTSPNINNYTRALTVLASSGYAGIEVYGGSTTAGAQIDFGGGTDRFASISGEYESATNGFLNIRTRRAGSMENAMRITSGGNVGIGTTSPLQKLHVEGLSYFGSDIFTYANGGIFFNGNSNYASGIYQNASGLNLQLGSTPRIFIANSGNVGIGTTSPSAKLHVLGKGIFDIGSSSGDVLVVDKLSGGNIAFNINGVYSGQIGAVGSGDLYIASKSTYPAIVVKDGGNVGIGTTSPAEKLEVQNGTAGAKIKVSNTGGGYAMLECSSNATSTATLSFTNSLALTGGNVGIGTTSPSEKLEVNGNIKFGDGSFNSTLNQAGIARITSTFTDQSNVQFYGHTGGAANNLIMTLRGGGNVGIGTTSPSKKLDVNGTASVSGIMSIPNMPYYANNAAALAGGLTYGDLYYSADASSATVKIVINFG